MKLFAATIGLTLTNAQMVDESTKVENYNVARSGDFENYRFTSVPDGFEGSFQNFNTTQVMEENKDDEIYREFEVLYSYVDSNLGRKEYSEDQKSMIRKVINYNRYFHSLFYCQIEHLSGSRKRFKAFEPKLGCHPNRKCVLRKNARNETVQDKFSLGC